MDCTSLYFHLPVPLTFAFRSCDVKLQHQLSMYLTFEIIFLSTYNTQQNCLVVCTFLSISYSKLTMSLECTFLSFGYPKYLSKTTIFVVDLMIHYRRLFVNTFLQESQLLNFILLFYYIDFCVYFKMYVIF